MRSGSYALALLAVPLNGRLLTQLLDGPMRLAELRSGGGPAPQTTVRAHLKDLERSLLVVKRTRKGTPGVADFELTLAGSELLTVAAALERWLLLAPGGAVDFGSLDSKAVINALEGGWSSTMLGTLVGGPQSLSQLGRSISAVSYPSLDRRLTAMHRAGQVQVCPSDAQGTSYEVTEWLQQGAASLAAAVRWERTHFADETAAMTRFDTEASFLLTLPLLQMSLGLSGSCRMEVEINDEEGPLCGAVALVERGKVMSCTAGANGPADSWASGSTPAWAYSMLGESAGRTGTDRLKLGGDKPLASGLLDGLHGALFPLSLSR